MINILDAIKQSLIKLNKEASKGKINKLENGTKVHRGRSPSLSSFFEFTLAEELSKAYPNYNFYVDYPIRLLDENDISIKTKGQSINPDIMISDKENKILKAIIEIKIDIGYIDVNREKLSKRDSYLKQAKKIKFNLIVGAYSDKEKEKNETIYLGVPSKLRKIAIIVTAKNHYHNKDEFEEILKEKGYTPIFLLESTHFNTINDISKEIDKAVEKKRELILRTFGGI
ncbi:MAG: hypothetical protein WAU65_02610 [Candidatus Nanoarchaeia archaeon]